MSFLSPIIVSIIFILIRKIANKGKYFIISIPIGYMIFIASNLLTTFLARTFIDTEELIKNGTDLEMVSNIVGWTTPILLFMPIIVFNYYLSKKYTKPATPQTNKSNQETKQ